MRRKRWIILKGPDRIVIRCHVPRREPPKRSKKINPDSIITYLVLCLLDVARTHIYLEPWIHREAIVSTCTWGKNSATTALYRHINLPPTRRGQQAGFSVKGLPGSVATPELTALSSWFVKQRQHNSHEDLTTRHGTSRLTPRVVMYTYGHALAKYKLYNGAHYALVERAKRTYGGFHGMAMWFFSFFH